MASGRATGGGGGDGGTSAVAGSAAGPGTSDSSNTWLIRTAQWRLRVAPNPQDRIRGGLEIVFVGVKIDAFSGEKGRNWNRGFLGA